MWKFLYRLLEQSPSIQIMIQNPGMKNVQNPDKNQDFRYDLNTVLKCQKTPTCNPSFNAGQIKN